MISTHRSALVVLRLVMFLFTLQYVLAHETTTTTTTTITSTTTITYVISISTSAWVTTITEEAPPTTSTPASTPTGDALFSSSAFQSVILNSTNYYRAHHQANPLVWNNTLAGFAQNHARRCLWQHSGGPYGENLAEGYAAPVLAVDAWGDEEVKYNYEKAEFSEATGHFTQLVWKNTTSVGCGAVKCDNNAADGSRGWLVVCEYTPRGNIIGLFKQSVGKPGISKDGVLGFASSADLIKSRESDVLFILAIACLSFAFLA